MTGKLVLENLKHRPMRSLLSILLIGVPVTLILCLVGLSRGMLEDGQTRSRGVGADIIIRASTSASIANFTGTSIPEALVAKVEQQPHVQMALGVIVHPFEVLLNVMGVDLDKFDRMSGGFTYLSGGPLQRPYDSSSMNTSPRRSTSRSATRTRCSTTIGASPESSAAASWRGLWCRNRYSRIWTRPATR